jgi:uncharacterized protein YgiM (DUF1202 family)
MRFMPFTRATRYALVLLIACATVMLSTAQTTITGFVNTNALNVRGTPNNLDNRPLFVINYGAPVQVIGRNADSSWYNVRLATGASGWVNGQYITITQGDIATAPITDRGCESWPCPGAPQPPPPVFPDPNPQPPPPTPAPPPRISAATGFVNTGALNVRQHPADFSQAPLSVIYRNQTLSIVGRNANNTWYQINTGLVAGWVNSTYITVTDGHISAVPITNSGCGLDPCYNVNVFGYVNTGALNVRRVPTVWWNVPIDVVYQWQTLELIGRNQATTWYQVRLNTGVTGWVSGQYITITQGATRSLPITR